MKSQIACTLGLLVAVGAMHEARADDASPLKSAIAGTKLILDSRLRVETVEQDGLAEDAQATTLRARLGFETGKAWNTTLLVEGEAVVPIQDDYRPDPAVARFDFVGPRPRLIVLESEAADEVRRRVAELLWREHREVTVSVRALVEVIRPAGHTPEPALDMDQVHVPRRLIDDLARPFLQDAHLLQDHLELRVGAQRHTCRCGLDLLGSVDEGDGRGESADRIR